MNYSFDVPCTVTKVSAAADETELESSSEKQKFCVAFRLPGDDAAGALVSSSSLPAGEQYTDADVVLLLRMNTSANIDDILELKGMKFKVT